MYYLQVYEPNSIIEVVVEKDNCSTTTIGCKEGGELSFQQNNCGATKDQVDQVEDKVDYLTEVVHDQYHMLEEQLTYLTDWMEQIAGELGQSTTAAPGPTPPNPLLPGWLGMVLK